MRAPWMIALLASLGLNLALGGVIAGQYLRGEQAKLQAQREAIMRLPNVRNLMAALPPDQAQNYRDALAQEWRNAREERRAAREARRVLAEAMRKEPFDESGVKAAFANVRAADAAVQARFHDTSVRVFAAMTPAERDAVINTLMRPPRARPGQGGRRNLPLQERPPAP